MKSQCLVLHVESRHDSPENPQDSEEFLLEAKTFSLTQRISFRENVPVKVKRLAGDIEFRDVPWRNFESRTVLLYIGVF